MGLIVVSPFVFVYEALIVILFTTLPIAKSLDDAPTRLYTIYQGTGILIVALLTYNIVLAPSPFSIVRTIDKLGKELKIPEKIGRKWVRFGDEEKAAFVIATLLKMNSGTERMDEETGGGGGGATPLGHDVIEMEDMRNSREKELEATSSYRKVETVV